MAKVVTMNVNTIEVELLSTTIRSILIVDFKAIVIIDKGLAISICCYSMDLNIDTSTPINQHYFVLGSTIHYYLVILKAKPNLY